MTVSKEQMTNLFAGFLSLVCSATELNGSKTIIDKGVWSYHHWLFQEFHLLELWFGCGLFSFIIIFFSTGLSSLWHLSSVLSLIIFWSNSTHIMSRNIRKQITYWLVICLHSGHLLILVYWHFCKGHFALTFSYHTNFMISALEGYSLVYAQGGEEY